MKKKEEFDLSIDRYALDEEWLGQPERYRTASDWAAMARKEYNEAKSDLDVVKAELYLAIRADPETYGLEKSSEAAIAAAVTVQPGYREAMAEMIDKKHQLDVMDGAVSALDQRKTALSKLVDLHLANYYSKPRASSEPSKERMGDVEKGAVRGRARKRLNLEDE